jgi:hypothetical protein
LNGDDQFKGGKPLLVAFEISVNPHYFNLYRDYLFPGINVGEIHEVTSIVATGFA